MRYNCPNRPTSNGNIIEEEPATNPYGVVYAESF